jgi:hypothetical protein
MRSSFRSWPTQQIGRDPLPIGAGSRHLLCESPHVRSKVCHALTLEICGEGKPAASYVSPRLEDLGLTRVPRKPSASEFARDILGPLPEERGVATLGGAIDAILTLLSTRSAYGPLDRKSHPARSLPVRRVLVVRSSRCRGSDGRLGGLRAA